MKGTRCLLVVDDDPDWAHLVRLWLRSAGYEVRVAIGGKAAVKAALEKVPDGVVLDLNMPDLSGLEVCRRIRSSEEARTVPVVILSGPTKEKVPALKAGADYFLPKSENPAELLAVLEALFRRVDMAAGVLTLGDLRLCPLRREVFLSGKSVAALTPKKFDLLYRLALSSPEPVSREDICARLGIPPRGSPSRAFDILLNRLRKSLPASLARRIRNVQGFGYLYLPSNGNRGGAPE